MRYLLSVVSCFAIGLSALPEGHAQGTIGLTGATQWVSPEEPGVLKGNLLLPIGDGTGKAVEDAHVVMVGASGEQLIGVTDERGRFVIKGVEPGIYALTASNGRAFAATAMQVVDATAGFSDRFPSEAEVVAGRIDAATVETAMERYVSPDGDQTAAAPPALTNQQVRQLSDDVGASASLQVAQIDGGMQGQLYQAGAAGDDLPPAGPTNIFVIKDGVEVARTVSSETGEFEIDQLDPGYYSMLAAGSEGIVVTGFELVPADGQAAAGAEQGAAATDQALVNSAGERFVLQNVPGAAARRALTIQVAPAAYAQVAISVVVDLVGPGPGPTPGPPGVAGALPLGPGFAPPGLGAPVPGGGFAAAPAAPGGGFGGGAGGGGGFLGGGGGLASLAGLAGLAALAASDDSDEDAAASPSSP